MSENSTVNTISVLQEDLRVFLKALEANDHSFCNIISNRLITNAVILNSKTYNLIGAILKEVVFEFKFFKNEEGLNLAKKKLKETLNNYLQSQENLNNQNICNDYIIYYNLVREYLLYQFEQEYSLNEDFSLGTTKYFLDFLKKELKTTEIPLNLDVIVLGTLYEINRVIKSFGCNREQLILKILLSFFNRLSDYFRFSISSRETSQRWNDSYKEFKNKLVNNLESFELSDSYIEKSVDLLYDICREWRHMFVRMLEIPKTLIVEKELTIPSNIKDNLTEMVSKMIDSKLEKEEE